MCFLVEETSLGDWPLGELFTCFPVRLLCRISSLLLPHSPESDPVKRGEGTEDALRFFISEAEEFLFLLIIVFCESKGQSTNQYLLL